MRIFLLQLFSSRKLLKFNYRKKGDNQDAKQKIVEVEKSTVFASMGVFL